MAVYRGALIESFFPKKLKTVVTFRTFRHLLSHSDKLSENDRYGTNICFYIFLTRSKNTTEAIAESAMFSYELVALLTGLRILSNIEQFQNNDIFSS